jgi:hypothetical protein
MKIVNLKTFLALPPDTLFSKYEPSVFRDLEIKGETLPHDFQTTGSLASCISSSSCDDLYQQLDRSVLTAESLKMDFDVGERDGCFDGNQLFAVWEDDDVIALIERLQRCVKRKV